MQAKQIRDGKNCPGAVSCATPERLHAHEVMIAFTDLAEAHLSAHVNNRINWGFAPLLTRTTIDMQVAD